MEMLTMAIPVAVVALVIFVFLYIGKTSPKTVNEYIKAGNKFYIRLIKREAISHDTYLFTFDWEQDLEMHMDSGHHMKFV